MGLTYAELTITNVLSAKTAKVNALVDSGAMMLCVPRGIALQLGYDPDECQSVNVTLADGTVQRVPKIENLRVEFANRRCSADALVLGDEPLMGVLMLEAMDLILDARSREVRVPPDRPNYAQYHAK